MITVYKKDGVSNEGQELELRGLSTDEKPTTLDGANMDNGAVFVEMDTGKIYMYDQENEQWKEM